MNHLYYFMLYGHKSNQLNRPHVQSFDKYCHLFSFIYKYIWCTSTCLTHLSQSHTIEKEEVWILCGETLCLKWSKFIWNINALCEEIWSMLTLFFALYCARSITSVKCHNFMFSRFWMWVLCVSNNKFKIIKMRLGLCYRR